MKIFDDIEQQRNKKQFRKPPINKMVDNPPHTKKKRHRPKKRHSEQEE